MLDFVCAFWTTPVLPELAAFWDVVSATQPRPASGLDSFVLLAGFLTRRNNNHGKSYSRTGQTYSENGSQSEGTISHNLLSSKSNRSRTHPMCCEWVSWHYGMEERHLIKPQIFVRSVCSPSVGLSWFLRTGFLMAVLSEWVHCWMHKNQLSKLN